MTRKNLNLLKAGLTIFDWMYSEGASLSVFDEISKLIHDRGQKKSEKAKLYFPVGTHTGYDSITGERTTQVYSNGYKGSRGSVSTVPMAGYERLDGSFKIIGKGITARAIEIVDPMLKYDLLGLSVKIAPTIIVAWVNKRKARLERRQLFQEQFAFYGKFDWTKASAIHAELLNEKQVSVETETEMKETGMDLKKETVSFIDVGSTDYAKQAESQEGPVYILFLARKEKDVLNGSEYL